MSTPAAHSPSAPAPATLGFGTGSLGSVTGYRAGCRLVEAAFDAGFRHFDVAPPYGNGAAERILGDVLASVRAQVVLVSKVGFRHPRGGGLVNAVRRVAAPVKRALPGLWGRAAQRTRALTSPAGHFTPEEIRVSLAESLKRLRTDRLDALLLHEAAADALDDATVATLLEALRQGQVGGLGTGTGLAHTLGLFSRYPQWLTWAQVPHWPAAFEPRLRLPGVRLCTHGCLRMPAPGLGELAPHGDAAGGPWHQVLTDPALRVPMLVQAALQHMGAGGVVVVSTTQPSHVRELALAPHAKLDAALVRRLNDHLAASAAATTPAPAPSTGRS